MAALAWMLWRARASAAREARLAQELEAVAAEAANLLAASLTSLDLLVARRPDPLADDARSASRALGRLLDATRTYARDDAMPMAHAEGCLRLTIAIARSRGAAIRLTGATTELPLRGSGKAACETLLAMFDALRGAVGDAIVDVVLERERVIVRGAGARVSAELLERAARCGWSVRDVDANAWEISELPGVDGVEEPSVEPLAVR